MIQRRTTDAEEIKSEVEARHKEEIQRRSQLPLLLNYVDASTTGKDSLIQELTGQLSKQSPSSSSQSWTLHFLTREAAEEEKRALRLNREGILELTHNHGTESDPAFAGYASGNADPGRGFGHIAVTVDDIEAACARFERLGVKFQKKLTDGKMRHIAFILDPDGCVSILPFPVRHVSRAPSRTCPSLIRARVHRYWVEILPGSFKP